MVNDTEDYSNITDKHYLFDTVVLFDIFTSLSTIVKDCKEVLSRSVLIEPKSGHVQMTINTGDIVVSIKVPIENTSHIINKPFVVEFKTLLSIIKNSGIKFLIREVNGVLKSDVLGGEVEFENFAFKDKLFTKDIKSLDIKNAVDIKGSDFMLFLERAIKFMRLAFRPEDKRVRATGGKAYFNFLSSLVIYKIDKLEASFRALDLSFLCKMCKSEPTIKVSTTDQYQVFQSNTWITLIPIIESDDLLTVKSIQEDFKTDFSFEVSPSHLSKILKVCSNILGNVGIIKLKIEGSELFILGETNLGKKLRFPIGKGLNNEMEIGLPVSSLISVISMVKQDSNLMIQVDEENQMRFEVEDVSIIFGNII